MAKITKDDFIKAIEEMSVLELNDLVKALEEKFDIQAIAPVAMAAPAGAAADAEPAEEQTIFNVWVDAAGANKLSVIKTLRELAPTLGLKEAKTKLTEAGATVSLK